MLFAAAQQVLLIRTLEKIFCVQWSRGELLWFQTKDMYLLNLHNMALDSCYAVDSVKQYSTLFQCHYLELPAFTSLQRAPELLPLTPILAHCFCSGDFNLMQCLIQLYSPGEYAVFGKVAFVTLVPCSRSCTQLSSKLFQ